jgi:hypothetical protein
MRAQPKHNAWSPLQGEHSNFCRNTSKALRSVTTQHATSYEVVMLHLAQGNREATSSSGERASSNIAIHSSREGVKGGRKRRRQCLQGATTTTNHDNGNDGVLSGSGVRHILTAARSDKRQSRPTMNHFKRLHEEAYPNHAYPVWHKLKDCGMMRHFMTLGSLT